MPEADCLTVTRAAYDTVASDYARLLADALDRMPWDRAALAAFATFAVSGLGGSFMSCCSLPMLVYELGPAGQGL